MHRYLHQLDRSAGCFDSAFSPSTAINFWTWIFRRFSNCSSALFVNRYPNALRWRA